MEQQDDEGPLISASKRKRERERSRQQHSKGLVVQVSDSSSSKKKKKKKLETNALNDDEGGDQMDEKRKDEVLSKDRGSKSLVELAAKMREQNPDYEMNKKKEEEEKFLKMVTAQQTGLVSVEERAKGIQYTDPIATGWRPTRKVRQRGSGKDGKIRKKFGIIVDGVDLPPPIRQFRDMRIPKTLQQGLEGKGIQNPTAIQMQGLPVAFSGRDMIGIAHTGSGKTITFVLPAVILAWGEQLKCPIDPCEGPFALLLGPSRELQAQTYENVTYFCELLKKHENVDIFCTLLMGGVSKVDQLRQYEEHGSHIVVATPGRLNDMLAKGRHRPAQMNLDLCRYIALDEADRLLDDGFDEDLQKTLGFCKRQTQKLLFSATFPKKIVEFAKTSLVKPVTVNVGRAGSANMNVAQEVEFVPSEQKIVYLLKTLEKTAPPVVIFAEQSKDCEEITEYLLLKGVEAVSIHGKMDQSDRTGAIQKFRNNERDVLVATDVAAKGLDFPAIQHVINFDMPKEIENYVHRIGRTGRSGNKGVATTFINNSCDGSILLDLKHLLKEAKQPIPSFLVSLEDTRESEYSTQAGASDTSCAYCNGLGHSISKCPKLQGNLRQQQNQNRDVVGSAAYGGNW